MRIGVKPKAIDRERKVVIASTVAKSRQNRPPLVLTPSCHQSPVTMARAAWSTVPSKTSTRCRPCQEQTGAVVGGGAWLERKRLKNMGLDTHVVEFAPRSGGDRPRRRRHPQGHDADLGVPCTPPRPPPILSMPKPSTAWNSRMDHPDTDMIVFRRYSPRDEWPVTADWRWPAQRHNTIIRRHLHPDILAIRSRPLRGMIYIGCPGNTMARVVLPNGDDEASSLVLTCPQTQNQGCGCG